MDVQNKNILTRKITIVNLVNQGITIMTIMTLYANNALLWEYVKGATGVYRWGKGTGYHIKETIKYMFYNV